MNGDWLCLEELNDIELEVGKEVAEQHQGLEITQKLFLTSIQKSA